MVAGGCSYYGETAPQPTFGPNDLRAFYDIAPVLSGIDGGATTEVVTIGTVDAAQGLPDLGDVQRYMTQYAHSNATLVVDQLEPPDSSSPTDVGSRLEEELDPEMVSVGAPASSSVHMVLAPEENLFPESFAYVVNMLPEATAVSISYGTCEPFLVDYFASGTIQAAADLVAQGTAEGQSWFAATGDNGIYTCGPNTTFPSVDFPADLPYVMAVGGTMYTGKFSTQAQDISSWGDESAWSEGFAAGGGGESQLFSRTPWQTGPGTHGTQRELPDIALLADLIPGVAMVFGDGGLVACGNGTSDASPMAAGMFAALSARLGCRLGAPAMELYAFARANSTSSPSGLHDITQGDNTIAGMSGTAAGPGYDEATGLGRSISSSSTSPMSPQGAVVPSLRVGPRSPTAETSPRTRGRSRRTGASPVTPVRSRPRAPPATPAFNPTVGATGDASRDATPRRPAALGSSVGLAPSSVLPSTTAARRPLAPARPAQTVRVSAPARPPCPEVSASWSVPSRTPTALAAWAPAALRMDLPLSAWRTVTMRAGPDAAAVTPAGTRERGQGSVDLPANRTPTVPSETMFATPRPGFASRAPRWGARAPQEARVPRRDRPGLRRRVGPPDPPLGEPRPAVRRAAPPAPPRREPRAAPPPREARAAPPPGRPEEVAAAVAVASSSKDWRSRQPFSSIAGAILGTENAFEVARTISDSRVST